VTTPRASIVALWLLAGCKPAEGTQPPDHEATGATEHTGDHDDATGANPECEPLPSHDEVRALFGAAREELAASREGEHFVTAKFEPAIARVRSAAEGGHREAQALYGSTMFGMMFVNDAPSPDQREDYVAAISFLRLAALGGDEDAAGFLPGSTADQPDRSEMPWSEIPAEWLTEAWARADAWMRCYGKPWT
jgi:hypothetical protein